MNLFAQTNLEEPPAICLSLFKKYLRSQRSLINSCVRMRFATTFFLLPQVCTVQSFCGTFSVATVNIFFVSEPNDGNITGQVFLATDFSCACHFASPCS